MAVKVRSTRTTMNGNIIETYPLGTVIRVIDGHLMVDDGNANTIAIFSPGNWVDAGVDSA